VTCNPDIKESEHEKMDSIRGRTKFICDLNEWTNADYCDVVNVFLVLFLFRKVGGMNIHEMRGRKSPF
jgi:hypothetical protein